MEIGNLLRTIEITDFGIDPRIQSNLVKSIQKFGTYHDDFSSSKTGWDSKKVSKELEFEPHLSLQNLLISA